MVRSLKKNGLKVVIQIPCYNEAETLHIALRDLPKSLPGIETIDVIVIDDGSSDQTAEVALKEGVDQVVSFPVNRGLAKGFMAGLEAALERGADIIVNTDADNQYNANFIADLIRPIVEKRADIVVGTRPISDIEHFSPLKKKLQKLGSSVMRCVSGTSVEDAPSGFRAFSREAALRLMVLTDYTYTMETLIHAGALRLKVETVPVLVNADLRPSRLVKSIPSYIRKSVSVMGRLGLFYRGPSLFWGLSGLSFVLALFLTFLPWISLSFLFLGMATLLDGNRLNRRLLEDIRYRQLKHLYSEKTVLLRRGVSEKMSSSE